jgi:large conductance mechanosensitive channel
LSTDDIKKNRKTEDVILVKRTLDQGFFDFLKTFGIIGLALAFVIGQAASGLVTSFVDDIVNPLIGLFLPAGSLYQLAHVIKQLSTDSFSY